MTYLHILTIAGLTICRGIVSAHGGRILCTEAPDGDCRFELAFPAQATRAQSAEKALVQPLTPLKGPGKPLRQGGRG